MPLTHFHAAKERSLSVRHVDDERRPLLSLRDNLIPRLGEVTLRPEHLYRLKEIP